MRKRRLFMSFLLLFLGVTLAKGQPAALDETAIASLKAGVLKASGTTQTIHSLFKQEKILSLLEEKILTSGVFWFKKENNLRWEYTDPFRYIIVIRGDIISIKDGDRVTAFNTQSNQVFAEVNRIIIGSVRGTLLDDPAFKASYARDSHHFLVTLVPLMPRLRENLQEILIYFDPHTFTVDKLVMKEPGGDLTTIRFFDKTLNKPIPDATFVLQ